MERAIGLLVACVLCCAGACGCEDETASKGARAKEPAAPAPPKAPVDSTAEKTAGPTRANVAGPIAGIRDDGVAVPGPASSSALADFTQLGAVRPDAARQWTVVLYFCGDNNLEDALLRDLDTVEQALPASGVEVIALMDRAKGFTDIDGDWTGAKVLRLRPDTTKDVLRSEVLVDAGELNLGDPKVLEGFVGAALKTFPAKRYALILSNHGAGWPDNCNDNDAPGAPEGADELILPEMRGALAGALRTAGVAQFDLIGFDMCLMGQLEVAAACKDLAQYTVACEALGPNDGFPFEAFIADFARAESDGRAMARRIVEEFGKYYEADGDPTATLSALDCSKVDAVIAALGAFASKLESSASRDWPMITRGIFFSEAYKGRTDYRRGEHAICSFDLADIAHRCKANMKDFAAEAEYQALIRAIDDAVVASYAGRMHHLSRGISIYAPVRGDNLRGHYAAQTLGEAYPWHTLLKRVHAMQAGQASPPKVDNAQVFTPEGQPTTQVTPLVGGYCMFDLEGSNLLWVLLDFSYRRPDGAFAVLFKTFHVAPGLGRRPEDTASELIDLLVPVYPDGKSRIGQELGGIMFQVTAGGKTVPATVEVSDPGDPLHAWVFGLLSDEGFGTDVFVEIGFNTMTWKIDTIIGHMPRPDGGTSVSRIRVGSKATVKLLTEVETTDGAVRREPGEPITWGDGPDLIMTVAPPGEHVLFVRAEAIGGMSSYAAIPYTVVANQALTAYLQGGDKLTNALLAGQWKLQGVEADAAAGRARWADLGVVVEIQQSGGGLTWKANIEGEQAEGPAELDTRGVPMLNFYVLDSDKNRVRVKAYVAILQREGAEPIVLLKDLGADEETSDMQRFIRPGAQVSHEIGGGQVNNGGVVPPPPASGLEGVWQGSEDTIVIQGNRFQIVVNGQVVDQGTFTTQGNAIRYTGVEGDVGVLNYQLAGDRLIITDPGGEVSVYQRAR